MDIDLANYHNNDILKSEYQYAKDELTVLFENKDFVKKMDYCFDKYYPSLNPKQRMKFLCRVYVATIKETKDKNNIEKDIYKLLPIHLFNLKSISSYRLFILEPNNACTYNCATYLYNRFSLKKDFKNDSERYIYYLLTAILRSLSSCFALFELGDDVHAFSLMRGFIEQEIKLCVLLKDKTRIERFIQFNQYNTIRRKGKEPKELKDLFYNMRCHSNSEKEAYLLYGWASDTEKIMSFRRLLDIYDSSDAEKIYALFGEMSEFVHEDYLGAGYDFIKMRKKYSDYLTLIFFKFLYPLIQHFFNRDILVLNGVRIKDLVNTNAIKSELKSSIPQSYVFRK